MNNINICLIQTYKVHYRISIRIIPYIHNIIRIRELYSIVIYSILIKNRPYIATVINGIFHIFRQFLHFNIILLVMCCHSFWKRFAKHNICYQYT